MSNEDIIRLMEFRQLKEEIRGSEDYLIVGIDIAKDSHHAFFGNATGKTFKRRLIFKNDLEGFSKLITHAEAMKTQNGLSKIVFGLEPTSNYHKPLGMHLIRCHRMVVMVSGVAVKRNRELLNGRWDKNDTKCAANVADLISQGKCLYYESPSSGISGLRELLLLRAYMKKKHHSLQMRIRNGLLAKHFPEFDRYFKQNTSESQAIVKWCLDPGRIAGMEFDEFVNTVTTKDRGIAQKRRLRNIYDLAVESIGCSVTQFTEFEAKILIDSLVETKRIVQEIDDQIDQAARSFTEYHCLLTIPGFGPYVSAMVLAIIGDPFRFENRGQVLKMSGFDLSANRSGKRSKNAVPVISKKGNTSLRYALFQAALVASARNSHFIKYYSEKLRGREKERGIKIKMRVKLAAKMLIIAWTLMKKKIDFNPDFLLIEE